MTTMTGIVKWLSATPDGVCREFSVDVNVWTAARVIVRIESYWVDAKSDELKLHERTASGVTVAQAVRKLRFPPNPVRPVKLSRAALLQRRRGEQKHMWKHLPCGYTGSTGGAGGVADETCPKCGYDVEDNDVNYYTE